MATADDTCRQILEAVDITQTGDQDAYITYSTILDIHLSNALKFPAEQQITVLETLHQILSADENGELVENIGWDVVTMLVPFLGRKATKDIAAQVLDVVVTKGNAKEVFLKCVEALKGIKYGTDFDDLAEEGEEGEATLAERLSEFTMEDTEVDPIQQTTELYGGIFKVFKRIRTERPSRFLTTFAAAMLTNLSIAFQSLVDSDQLHTLHTLMLDFITSSISLYDLGSDKGKGVKEVIAGVVSTYIPVYMGNRLLFWSGRYWEESHPVISNRVKSKELVNEDLEKSVTILGDLAEKLGVTTERLYDNFFPQSLPEDIDPDSVYPDGDSFIPIDPLGSLLLFSNKYTLNPTDTETCLLKHSTKDLLSLHKRLVDSYLDEASFNIIDAILLLGLHLSTSISSEDLPSFVDPTDAPSSDFLEYLQRMAATAATCASENLRPLLYTLVETLLSKCPEHGRLYYILDTLDNCPYDNLKVAVIGTLKKQLSSPAKESSLFSAPGLLNEIGPRLFRLPSEVLEDEETALDKVTFIIECLSLYRLLLLKKEDTIGVKDPGQVGQTNSSWLVPLRKSVEKWIKEGGTEEEDEERLLMWRIVFENLDRIDEASRSFMS